MNFVSVIFNTIMTLVLTLVKIILLPFDLLIRAALPQISDGLTAVGEFIEILAQGIGWAISASGVPYAAIALIATYYIFRLTLPINIWIVKLAIKWYTTLKP